MQLNKIKLALGFVAGLTVAMPMVASAAADQEKAIANANNWAHPRGNHTNQAFSQLTQINKCNKIVTKVLHFKIQGYRVFIKHVKLVLPGVKLSNAIAVMQYICH